MPRFVFLEFTNPKVREFLTGLREIFENAPPKIPAHITVRGPYQEAPNKNLITSLNEELKGNGVVIGGAGIFSLKDRYSVYLKAQSPVFEALWWKPDFPKGGVDIKPHVTVYETVDSQNAKVIESFLRKERIEIFTFGLQLSIYSSKQPNLFSSDIDPVLQKKRSEWERWRVPVGILDRAKRTRDLLAKK